MLQYQLHIVTQARYIHWCNSAMTVMAVTSCVSSGSVPLVYMVLGTETRALCFGKHSAK